MSPSAPAPDPERLLPPEFIARLGEMLAPAGYEAVLASYREPRRCTFRVNTLLTDLGQARAELDKLGMAPRSWEWLAEGFDVPVSAREALLASDLCEGGAIYVQDYSSMVPPVVLAPRPGEEVLDLAAAPGGKTLHLAALMANEGRLAAVEVVKSRFHRLRHNLERGGASCVALYHKDGCKVGRQVGERFDRVLLDAPCSSEARFKLAEPESWQYWSERKIAEMQRKQKQLLYSAVLAAKPGAPIVYSTCSFAPEENEAVIAHVLKKFAGRLAVEPLHLPFDNALPGLIQWRGKGFDAQVAGAVRILPTATMGGFFVCLLRKGEGRAEGSYKSPAIQ